MAHTANAAKAATENLEFSAAIEEAEKAAPRSAKSKAGNAEDYTGKLWFKALRALFAPVRLFLRWKRLLCKDPGEFFRRASVGGMRFIVFLFFAEAVGLFVTGVYTGAFFFGVFTFISAYFVANYDGE